LHRAISEVAATPGELDDDFSLIVLTFE